jgi:hypothetical protein
MGHSSVTTTERYPHLRTDPFRVEDYDRLSVDMRAVGGVVVPMKPAPEAETGAVGYAGATLTEEAPAAAHS